MVNPYITLFAVLASFATLVLLVAIAMRNYIDQRKTNLVSRYPFGKVVKWRLIDKVPTDKEIESGYAYEINKDIEFENSIKPVPMKVGLNILWIELEPRESGGEIYEVDVRCEGKNQAPIITEFKPIDYTRTGQSEWRTFSQSISGGIVGEYLKPRKISETKAIDYVLSVNAIGKWSGIISLRPQMTMYKPKLIKIPIKVD